MAVGQAPPKRLYRMNNATPYPNGLGFPRGLITKLMLLFFLTEQRRFRKTMLRDCRLNGEAGDGRASSLPHGVAREATAGRPQKVGQEDGER